MNDKHEKWGKTKMKKGMLRMPRKEEAVRVERIDT
jgi:hypothetical protein